MLIFLRVWLVLGLIGSMADLIIRRRAVRDLFRIYGSRPYVALVGALLGMAISLVLGPAALIALVFRRQIGLTARDEENSRRPPC